MTERDVIQLEVEINDSRQDLKDLAEIDDCVCNAMLEAGIPILYTLGPLGRKIFSGLQHGTLEGKNITSPRFDAKGQVTHTLKTRLIIWRRELNLTKQ